MLSKNFAQKHYISARLKKYFVFNFVTKGSVKQIQSFCNCVVKCASQGSHEAEQTQGNEEHGIEWDQGLKHISDGCDEGS